jgi:hypothetical protein
MQTSVLHHSSYSPLQGGHAPGDIREAFCDAVDAFDAWKDGEPSPRSRFAIGS